MISLENVLMMTCIKSPQLSAPMSRGVFSKEDALGVLAMVQSKHQLGMLVLQSKIAGDEAATRKINRTASLLLINRGFDEVIARGMAFLAAREVCGTPRCELCNGTGERLSRRYSKMFECPACHGTGKILLTSANLAAQLSALTGKNITKRIFSAAYYDDYMDIINELHVAETAASYAIREELEATFEQTEVC